MKHFLLLIAFVMAWSFSSAQANLSLQIGYNFSNINPTQYNFAVDSIFNLENAVELSPARWASGLAGAIAIHRGRSAIRIAGRIFNTESNAINRIGNEDQRTDISFYGGHISADLTSRLLDIGPYMGIYVGAGLSANYFQTATATVPLDQYDATAPLETTSQDWRIGFKLHIPYRIIIPRAHVGFSLEPYFMVFFSNIDVEPFSNALNGPSSRVFSDSMDHFGVTGKVMIFLRGE